jgi:hypothetical protein
VNVYVNVTWDVWKEVYDTMISACSCECYMMRCLKSIWYNDKWMFMWMLHGGMFEKYRIQW